MSRGRVAALGGAILLATVTVAGAVWSRGRDSDDEPTRAPGRLGVVDAYFVRPHLRFDGPAHRLDTGREKWRPVRISTFLAERAAGARHVLCGEPRRRETCTPVQGIPTSRDPDRSWLDILGDETRTGDGREFRANVASCAATRAERRLYDCNRGPTSAIYYHVAQPERGPYPADYVYIDYWFFYRFNDATPPRKLAGVALDPRAFDHEGDWEGMTVVALPSRREQVQWVQVAAHKHIWRYLPDTLIWRGSHPQIFVARGTHASYVRKCTSNCTQGVTDELPVPLPESRFNGKAQWGWNGEDARCRQAHNACLIPIEDAAGRPVRPLGWPWRWGSTRRPAFTAAPRALVRAALASRAKVVFQRAGRVLRLFDESPCPPGYQGRYFPPWAKAKAAVPGTGPHACRLALADPADDCPQWRGPFVAVAVCAKPQLSRAVEHGTLSQTPRYSLTLDAGKRKYAVDVAPGIAQVVGRRPLRIGDKVTLAGPLPAGTEVFMRFGSPVGPLDAHVEEFRLSAGGTMTISLRRRLGRPKIVAVRRDAGNSGRTPVAVGVRPDAVSGLEVSPTRNGVRVAFRSETKTALVALTTDRPGEVLAFRRLATRPGAVSDLVLANDARARFVAVLAVGAERLASEPVYAPIPD